MTPCHHSIASLLRNTRIRFGSRSLISQAGRRSTLRRQQLATAPQRSPRSPPSWFLSYIVLLCKTYTPAHLLRPTFLLHTRRIPSYLLTGTGRPGILSMTSCRRSRLPRRRRLRTQVIRLSSDIFQAHRGHSPIYQPFPGNGQVCSPRRF